MSLNISFSIIILVQLFNSNSAFSQTLSPPDSTTALVVFARDKNDHYPMPSPALRDSIYKRLSNLYETVSYGRHHLKFKEGLNDGGYFIADQTAGYYKQHYNHSHLKGYGMFNEEILYKVRKHHGDSLFRNIDLILMMSTDGGPDWYVRKQNATGYGALGVTFEAGGRKFGRGQGQGGITIEIGSDIGTSNPRDDRIFSFYELTWNIAHEYGHWLKLGHRPQEIGIFSLMTQRIPARANQEFGPNPLDIFDIIKLGWLDERDSTRIVSIAATPSEKNITLKQVRSHQGPVIAKIFLPMPHDMLFATYHHREANRFDALYPESGVLIWHRRYNQVTLLKPESSNPENVGDGMETEMFINQRNPVITLPLPQSGQTDRTRLRISLLQQSNYEVKFQLRLENY